jgi:hypothetical protein
VDDWQTPTSSFDDVVAQVVKEATCPMFVPREFGPVKDGNPGSRFGFLDIPTSQLDELGNVCDHCVMLRGRSSYR